MRPQSREYEQLRGVLSEADEPLTAKEILRLVEEREEFESAHRVATILGRWADEGDVEVLQGSPYRYRLNN
jgi:predicted Zn-ribbon and HTH transcriptional regulator